MSRNCRVNRTLTNRIAQTCGAVWLLCSSLALASVPANNPLNPALIAARWPAFWIASANVPGGDPGVFYFRREILLSSVPAHFWVHVSADNRFLLHVNGKYAAEGPARGDLFHWRFETVDLAPLLQPGKNVLAAIVWNFGELAPVAQMSNRTGFLMQGDTPAEAAVNTGKNWQIRREPGRAALGMRAYTGITPQVLPKRSTGVCSIGHGTSPAPILRVGKLRACWDLQRRARRRMHRVIGSSFRIHFPPWSIGSSMRAFPSGWKGWHRVRGSLQSRWRFKPTPTSRCCLTIARYKPLIPN